MGAEYCPYCAAERWALAVALSRFGSFSHLSATHSAGTDVYPNTQTLSFYASSYSSPFVDFQAVEEATNQVVNGSYQTLQTPTAAQRALMAKYDSSGSIPFLDIANKYVITGASFSPQVLQGLSREQIAAQLSDPSSPVALAIDGTANDITAAICNVTGNLPSSVGNSSAIAAIAKTLGHDHGSVDEPASPELGARHVARPLSGRSRDRLVPHRCPLRRSRRTRLPGPRGRELHVGHHQPRIRCARSSAGRARTCLGRSDGGSVRTVGLACRSAELVERTRLVATGVGALTVVYLVYTELYRIGAICLWCTAMHVTAVALFGVVMAARGHTGAPVTAHA